jgi:hypothetical protein
MSTRLAERINFSSIKNASKYPDFLDIQIKSKAMRKRKMKK